MFYPSSNPLSRNTPRLEDAGERSLKKYERIPVYEDFQEGAIKRGIKSPKYAPGSLMNVPIIKPKVKH